MENGNKRGLLKCKVGKGMFEEEQIVSFDVKGNIVSAIVDKESVKDKNWLEVDVCGRRKNELLIGIPGETFSTSRKIWVSKEKVK